MSGDGAVVTASTAQGALRGRRLKTPSGRTFASFQGVPYAKPPVGPLRFEPPEAPSKWTGVLDATVERNVPPQIDLVTKLYKGNEDCLYLNIYTPQLPTVNITRVLPVMVWIFGGGFIAGSGNTDMYGPEYLMEHDVVLVTLNYRLGVLGFFSTEDQVAPGNLGLKDQVAALKWVKKNVCHFGGDPANVTVFGESAGAMSVHLLLISPATAGLFHRAICQSGAYAPAFLSSSPRDRAFRLGKLLGFSGSTSGDLVRFLKQQPAQKLIEISSEVLTNEEKQRLQSVPFLPIIEKPGSHNSVITEDPLQSMKEGHLHRVPVIFGVTSREGLFFIPELLQNKSLMSELNTNFECLLPVNIPVNKEGRAAVAEDVKQFYFKDQPLAESTVDKYGDLRGDLAIVYPSFVAARAQSSVEGGPPVYFYNFNTVTSLNVFKIGLQVEQYPGACHGDDLSYLFPGTLTKDNPKGPETVEGKAIALMTKLWTNFAKTGNPTPFPDDPVVSKDWSPFKQDEHWYLDISNDGARAKKDLFKERMNFWDNIFSQ